MTEILTWLQTYETEFTVGAFFALQGLLLLLLLVNGHRLKKIRRKMNQITKQAEEFLQSMQAERKTERKTEKVTAEEAEPVQKHAEREKHEKQKPEEEENGLITAVLREIFP